MNDFEWIENQIIKWGKDKDLIGEKGNSKRQVEKTFEELNELGDALYFENTDDAIDAYGDIIVTIIIGYAQFCFEKNINHSRIIDAVNSAYEEIKDRSGFTLNGTFIKDSLHAAYKMTFPITSG